jgi:hypothetical protein
MKPQHLLAEQIERIADSMAYFIETTSPDVLAWNPEMPGSAGSRSILQMVAECVAVNQRFTAKLSDKDSETIQEPGFESGEEAVKQILDSGRTFAAVIRTLPDEALSSTYLHKGTLISGTYLVVGAYRNMAYHCGQINLIQMLKGDPHFHRPPSWDGPARPYQGSKPTEHF